MGDKGIISRHVSRDGKTYYSCAMLAIGMYEFQIKRLTKEFYKDFLQYLEEAFIDEFLSTKIPQLRTIPTEGSILPELPIETYDHVRHLIADYKKPIGIANCICKTGKDLIGEPCKVTDMREICFVFGGAAVKYEKEHWGRFIEKDEAFKILKQAEKDGLVIQPSNTKDLFAMCLCCGCCCEILSSTNTIDNPVQYFSTNYFAKVDKEICIGCGICAKRCQMNAIGIINKKSVVDLSKCIGCGLCVTTCKPKAINLEKREKETVPPKNSVNLYMKIMRKKVGNAKYILMITKQILGKKI